MILLLKYFLILLIVFQPTLGGSAMLSTRGSMSAQSFGMFRKNNVSGSTNVIYLTSTGLTTWTVPADWNSSNNRIELIGGGGGGAATDASDVSAGGGGGGAYAAIQNLTLTPGATIDIRIGSGGAGGLTSGGGSGANGGDTWFHGASCAASSACAKGGTGAIENSAGGAGGSSTASIGQLTYAGGTGGSVTNMGWSGGGGGGAGGPFGPGGTGGSEVIGGGSVAGAPGGGGGGGGATGTNITSNTTTGAAGGNNSSGTGAGAGGSGGTNGTAGTAGTAGGGGGGGGGATGTGAAVRGGAGGAGGPGTDWDATHGSGGGGGGGGGARNGSAKGEIGGSGGLYGGGGGGGGAGPGGHGNGGAGAQGIIMITYGPTVPATRVIALSHGTSWTVPANWNNAGNTIECIGGGGGGGVYGFGDGGGAGGGGGAYAKLINHTLTPGDTISYQIGAGGASSTNGGDSWFGSTGLLLAKGGGRGNGITLPGAGGSALSSVGTIKFSGGEGYGSASHTGGGGGGGSAGPLGNGGAGSFGYQSQWTGGGGGGNGGGTSAVNAISGQGGAGGNNSLGTGGGAPGTDGNSLAAVTGVNGGGGGGTTHDSSNDGGPGGSSSDLATSPFRLGSGGGGGGAGAYKVGGAGARFGGGGGGGAWVGGVGGNGICVITYTVNLSNNLGAFTISGITGGSDTTVDDSLNAVAATPTVSWSASANASVYKVKIFADDGTTVVCSDQYSTTTSYNFSSCALAASTYYRAQVTAINTRGELVASNSTFRFQSVNQGAINILGQSTPSNPNTNEATGIVFGAKFRSTCNGKVAGVRFYRGFANGSGYSIKLWNSGGTNLATKTGVTNAAIPGWNEALFTTPITISTGTTYVVSYFDSIGRYPSSAAGLTSAVTNGCLTMLADGTDGGNGVYKYNGSHVFPNETFNASNYFVDVIFEPDP